MNLSNTIYSSSCILISSVFRKTALFYGVLDFAVIALSLLMLAQSQIRIFAKIYVGTLLLLDNEWSGKALVFSQILFSERAL